MKLSIITCTYNSEKYLQECLEGITSQWLKTDEYEHIFIDAFSTDKTLDIIGKYKKNNIDHTINIIQQKPQWIYHAMNEWIKQSWWEYLMFCNSDDYLQKNMLKNYINHINKTHKKDIYYARFNRESGWRIIWTIPSSNRIVLFLQKILFYIWLNTLVYHPTTIIKKSLFDELWYYDETKKIASDYGFWLNCIKYKKTFVYFPYVVNNFRVNEWSITSNPANKQIEMNENYYFRKKYLWWWWVIIHQISKLYVYFSSNSNKW
jgi:glycosyltransferase involved in cell wall biosynthesis